jgi:hypothetical protein
MPETGFTESHQDETPKPTQAADYYEVLQINRNADEETIHRVYRIMALRFHPDNPTTGDLNKFLELRRAYQMLSDPVKRAEHDANCRQSDSQPLPIFELKDFVYGVEGEVNRRLGILSLLYHRRRTSEDKVGISVLDLEKRMGFPREHLDFTLWYLRAKGYIQPEDNSDYALTSEGVDFVEKNSSTNRVIRQLLTAPSGHTHNETPAEYCAGGGDGAASSDSGTPVFTTPSPIAVRVARPVSRRMKRLRSARPLKRAV